MTIVKTQAQEGQLRIPCSYQGCCRSWPDCLRDWPIFSSFPYSSNYIAISMRRNQLLFQCLCQISQPSTYIPFNCLFSISPLSRSSLHFRALSGASPPRYANILSVCLSSLHVWNGRIERGSYLSCQFHRRPTFYPGAEQNVYYSIPRLVFVSKM